MIARGWPGAHPWVIRPGRLAPSGLVARNLPGGADPSRTVLAALPGPTIPPDIMSAGHTVK